MWRSVTWCRRKSRSQHHLADPLNILDIIQMESNLSLLREKAATMRYDSRLMLNIAFLHNAGAALRRGSRMGAWTVFGSRSHNGSRRSQGLDYQSRYRENPRRSQSLAYQSSMQIRAGSRVSTP